MTRLCPSTSAQQLYNAPASLTTVATIALMLQPVWSTLATPLCTHTATMGSQVASKFSVSAHPQHSSGLTILLGPNDRLYQATTRCSGCDTTLWRSAEQLPLLQRNSKIGLHVEAEHAGRLYEEPISPPRESPLQPMYQDRIVDHKAQPDLYNLLYYLKRVESIFPDTHWPIPILNRRAARLYLHNRVMSLEVIKVAIGYLSYSLEAYKAVTEPTVTPTACAISIELLTVRLTQLTTLVNERRPSLPRLQRLRLEPSIRPTVTELRGVITFVKMELGESERMMEAVYRQCKGDLWERFQRIKADLLVVIGSAS